MMRLIPCLAILTIAGCAVPPSPTPLSVQPAETSSSVPTDSAAAPADARLASLDQVRAPAPQAASGGRRGSVSMLLGYRELDDDEFWEPLDEHGVLGFDADIRPGGFPLGVCVMGVQRPASGVLDPDSQSSPAGRLNRSAANGAAPEARAKIAVAAGRQDRGHHPPAGPQLMPVAALSSASG